MSYLRAFYNVNAAAAEGMMSIAEFHRVVEEMQAIRYLGIALHAVQDIPAHGQIDAGSDGFWGHAPATINNFIADNFSVIGPALHRVPDPDSVRYQWADESQTRLMFFLGEAHDNPRIVHTRSLTIDVLLAFAYGAEMTHISFPSTAPCDGAGHSTGVPNQQGGTSH